MEESISRRKRRSSSSRGQRSRKILFEMMLIQSAASKPLQKLLSHIIVEYLSKLYCICVVWTSQDIDQIPLLSSDVLSIKSPSGNSDQLVWLNVGVDRRDINEKVRTGINVGCQAFVVTSSVALSFLESYDNTRFTAENRYFLMRMVLVQPNIPFEHPDVVKLLSHPVIYDIPNLLVITGAAGKNESYDLITSKFTGRWNYSQSMHLDTFDGQMEQFTQNVNLFPDKSTNLNGRVVRIAMFGYKPYSFWQEVEPGTGNANQYNSSIEKSLQIDGTETLMFLEFCTKFNCTLEAFIDEVGEWGNIYDNVTGDGVLGAVAERRVDIGFTALYSWHHEFQFLDFTSAITRTGITCLCPKPKLLGGLMLPAMPFKLALWIGVITSFIGIVASVFVIRMVQKKSRIAKNAAITRKVNISGSTLQVWAAFLLQPVNMLNRHIPEMIVFGCISVISILIGNAYGGGLASILTLPHYEPPIDTVHQLAEKNQPWGATHDAWIFSILMATQPEIKKLVELFRPLPVEVLYTQTRTGDMSFSVERLPYGHFAVGEYIDQEALKYLQLMRNDIYYEYCVGMSYKTWPFKANFDLFIERVAESGIQKYWELQTIIMHDDSKIQLGISISRHREHQGPISLKTKHLIGVFIIWAIGMAFSVVIFIVELVIYKMKSHVEILA